MSRGDSETKTLQTRLQTQLERLLDQLQDLPALTAEQGGAEFDMQRQWAQPPEIEVVDESEEVADPRMAMLDDGTEVQMPAL